MTDSSPHSVLNIDDESAPLDLGKLYLERKYEFIVDIETYPEKGLLHL